MNSSILLISHLSKVVLQFVDEAIPSELRECANRASRATRCVADSLKEPSIGGAVEEAGIVLRDSLANSPALLFRFPKITRLVLVLVTTSPIVVSANPVLTNGLLVLTNGLLVLTNGLPFLVKTAALTTTENPLVTNGFLVLTNGLIFLVKILIDLT